MHRCLCCGTTKGVAHNVCARCRRDAQRNPLYADRVALAEQGFPQVCMACGWDKSCRCAAPDRRPRPLPPLTFGPPIAPAAGGLTGLNDEARQALTERAAALSAAAAAPAAADVPVPPAPARKAPMMVSLDGGSTWADAPEGVQVFYGDLPVPRGKDSELHINLSPEGIIFDVWVSDPEEGEDYSIGTSSETVDEITYRLTAADQ